MVPRELVRTDVVVHQNAKSGGPCVGRRGWGLVVGVQATAAWQWHNFYVLRKVPPGRTHVRINLDETSICLFQGDSKGTVLIDKRQGVPLQNVPRARRRCCLTHVAFVCDSADLQVHLPQVIIGNESTFSPTCSSCTRAGESYQLLEVQLLCRAIVRDADRPLMNAA